MKLNDPFGRVSRRNLDRYAALRARLLDEGIRDTAKVRRFRQNMTATLLRLVALVSVCSAAVALPFPAARGPALLCGALALLWLIVGYAQTRLYLARYLREECSDAGRS